MYTRDGPGIGWCVPLVLSTLMLSACSSAPTSNFNLRVKDQQVPVVVAIGPFDVSGVTHKGAPVSNNLEASIQEMFHAPLKNAGIFKEVKILKLDKPKEGPPDAETVLALARDQQADLLIVGEVKEFEAAIGFPMPKSQYDVTLRFLTQLYNVHNRRLVWSRKESAQVTRNEWRTGEKLKEIVERYVMPSITAGTVSPLANHIQTAYVNSQGQSNTAAAEEAAMTLFGGAELARIDADLTPPLTRMPLQQHAYAVIIGVENYRDLPMVDYATRDVEWVKKYLITSLGYQEQNVVMLVNDRVTRSQLEARFERWLPTQVKNQTDAEVFVYYAGHGAPDPNTNQAFLVPYDGDPAFLETTGYPITKLYKILSELPAKHVTVVLDTCFSGSGGRSVIAKGTRPMLITVNDPVVTKNNMVVFTAAGGNQISSAYREKRHGLFTYYYLKGLQGQADKDQDGMVDVEELDTYLKANVQTVARRLNVEQTPQLLPGLDLMGGRAKSPLIQIK
ncbi:MAG TPA: caspase family protein [Nitrospira sp.]|nr:caspase family protein [Nitrospira sp.]